MNIQQLKCFVSLAETLNFSTTANKLNLTQPAVSHNIKSLENELGIVLVVRNKRTVNLTVAGNSFYEDIEGLLFRLDQSIKKAKRLSEKYDSTLIIGYTETVFEKKVLPDIIKRFKEKYPQIQIQLKKSNLTREKDDLLNQKFDIIFTTEDNLGKDIDFCFYPVLKGSYVCVLPQNHPLANERELTFEQLNHKSIILFNEHQSPPTLKSMHRKIIENCPESSFTYGDTINTIHTMIKSDLGVSVLPNFVVVEDNEISFVPLSYTEEVIYGVACLRGEERLEVKRWISTLKELLT
ncbi:transcriptional regulator [Paenibacillus jamilae]|uniref:Transcriptional regulator n=2 Tax=Paenibacillus TaxID=44249 RepID=E3ECD7_PAEPS|nr:MULTISPECIES: LysR family transcriptional regulator [Paenibacillus]ADO54280.1 transcriptional regulator [Paenibacillus polymyxa SC2]AJE51427.1 transcriptional regulator [Paenibacillus polymyxa]AUO06209.1 LysR family transcriptional regulator [Paenibacillus sp. lzh-N1]KTS82582.1 transcriptional regulator [Paenibacillus jamilae]QOH60158.1 LysR family transcriptional regulator [Paenibacillus polymyxa]